MVYSLKRGFVVICAVLSCKISSHVYTSAKHCAMYEPLGSHCGVREKTRMCTAGQSFHGCHRRKYRELGNAQQSFGSLVLFFFQCLALKIKFLLYNISQPQSLGLSRTPASQPQGSWEYKCQCAKIKPQLRCNDGCPSLPLSQKGIRKRGESIEDKQKPVVRIQCGKFKGLKRSSMDRGASWCIG